MFQSLADVESIPHWNLEMITLFSEQETSHILVLWVTEHRRVIPTSTGMLKKKNILSAFVISLTYRRKQNKIILIIFFVIYFWILLIIYFVIYFWILILAQKLRDWFLDYKFSLRSVHL